MVIKKNISPVPALDLSLKGMAKIYIFCDFFNNFV